MEKKRLIDKVRDEMKVFLRFLVWYHLLFIYGCAGGSSVTAILLEPIKLLVCTMATPSACSFMCMGEQHNSGEDVNHNFLSKN